MNTTLITSAAQRARSGPMSSRAGPRGVSVPAPVQRKNQTGLPDNLKAGIEALSCVDLSEVRVHRNSKEPARLSALAFAQGRNIHLAPGQDQHLPHEAWHVVQQAQGRVAPTARIDETPVNDSPSLEHEADQMGAKAVSRTAVASTAPQMVQSLPVSENAPVQGVFDGDLKKIKEEGLKTQLAAKGEILKYPELRKLFNALSESSAVYNTIEDVLAYRRDQPAVAKEKPESSSDDKSKEKIVSAPMTSSTPSSSSSAPSFSSSVPTPGSAVTSSASSSSSSSMGPPAPAGGYMTEKQLGDGSHHTAYSLKDEPDWILLVQKDGDNEKSLANRGKAYSMIGLPQVTAKMNGIVTAAKPEGDSVRGVLMERMHGTAYHSTNQGWNFGLSKQVQRWRKADGADLTGFYQKVERLLAGMNAFIAKGVVIEDFQYWVTDEGEFRLSDVKSAVRGNPRETHGALVDCCAKLQGILNEVHPGS